MFYNLPRKIRLSILQWDSLSN